MKNYLEIIKRVQLFINIIPEDIESLLNCLGAKTKKYTKGDYINYAGNDVTSVGIVLYGSVDIIKEDCFGRRIVLTRISDADIFGEVFACAGIKKSPVSVYSATDSEIMFIDYARIINTCSNSCNFHNKIIQNMIKLIAMKNLLLNKKIDFLVIKGLREKLVLYLFEQYNLQNNLSFSVSYDRAGLAEYLNVDRSAMSRELCKMRDEGLISFNKNNFTLIKLNELKKYYNDTLEE